MNNQEWLPVGGYEGTYEVSNDGRVRNLRSRRNTHEGKVLRPQRAGQGYLKVSLCLDGTGTQWLIHRLVATAFHGPPDDVRREVNHKDGDKLNNRAENLEWCTRGENRRHAVRMGLWKPPCVSGEAHGGAKLRDQDIHAIRHACDGRLMSRRRLAGMFDVCLGTIDHAASRYSWKCLPQEDIYKYGERL